MSLLSELFSDLFARQDHPLSRIDPRTKLVAAVALLMVVVLSPTPLVALAVSLGCVGVVAGVGVPVRLIMIRMTGPMVIAGVLLVLQSVLTGGTPLRIIESPVISLTVTVEGWRSGVLTAARVLGGMGVMMLLSAVTPAHRIFVALRALGVSKGWVEIAMLMYRYIFVLMDLTADVAAAQRLRLGYSSIRRGMSSAGVVAGMVVLRAVDQAVRTHDAMRVRGYQGSIPVEPMAPLAWNDRWIMACAVVTAACVIVLTKGGFV